MLLVFEDITDRKQRERDARMLTNEISHRIKNNLQIVVGLIAYEIKSTSAASVPGLKAMQARIGAIAQLYDLISQSSRGGSIAVDAYLSEIAKQMSASLIGDKSGIEIRVKAEPLEIDPDRAVPFGLLVNELATNAYQARLPHGGVGHVLLAVEQVEDEIELVVSDDGIGIKDKVALELPGSAAPIMSPSLSASWAAPLTRPTPEGKGTTIRIRLPLLLVPAGGAAPLAA